MLSVARRQAGDTIVEVLVVLAIVGLALAISYATANRSLVTVRSSHEHSIALQTAQSQLEQLRAILQGSASGDKTAIQGYAASGTVFCFQPSGGVAAYSAVNCTQLSLYSVKMSCKRDLAGTCLDIYTTTVNWPSLTDTTVTNAVDLTYRVYTQ